MTQEETIRVGVGVMIMKEGRVLLGKRTNIHGDGEYAWPGGHMEYMESFEGCAKRETLEETDMEIQNVRFLRLLNLKAYAPRHYVNIAFIADWKSGEPKIMESDKVESWDWYSLDALPSPLFATVNSCVEAYKTGRTFWDE